MRTRLEAGAIRVNRQPAEVQDLVGSSLEQLGRRVSSRKIKIDLSPDLPFIAVDFSLIVQVLVNILDNAVKYSSAGSLIEIKAFTREKDLIIEIADQGLGVPASDLEHIFDKFYRVPAA